MKFQFRQHGFRFFFITLSTAGRQPILSRLERGVKRPLLSVFGEQVRQIWITLNSIDQHLIPSDFIIMPDHLHLLLIVKSVGDYPFSPLVFSHWFMQASSTRKLPLEKPFSWTNYYLPNQEECLFEWSQKTWVEFILSKSQLAATRRYIRMNPSRYFWKLDHPDMFVRQCIVGHPLLSSRYSWNGCGNLSLLASPFLYHVRLTRASNLAGLEAAIDEYVERAEHGCIPISGFLSEGEREFERRIKELKYTRWIKAVPYALPERFDPSVEDSQYLAEQRELILSSFSLADGPSYQVRRENCLAMNERIAELVRGMNGTA